MWIIYSIVKLYDGWIKCEYFTIVASQGSVLLFS